MTKSLKVSLSNGLFNLQLSMILWQIVIMKSNKFAAIPKWYSNPSRGG